MKKLKKLLARKSDANKGDFGHVLIIGGDYGMAGAIILAAEAAYRTGAGKVSVLSREENYTALLARLPNAMTIFGEADLEKFSVIVIGPGLGKSKWAKDLLTAALKSKLPKIIDADALNLISEMKKIPDLENCIITPHPSEAARLLGISTNEIQKNRQLAAEKLYKKFNAISVLKGKGSLICGENFMHNCNLGNAGMAVAGMGDVLCGVIAALVAQKLNLEDAAVFGVEIHALAGDLVAQEQGEIGIIPSDLFFYIPLIVNQK